MPAPAKTAAARAQPPAAHQIHSLLQTMRAIHQHEDQFCTLMHSIETAGRLNAAESRELHKLLDQMPGPAFQHDLDLLRESLLPPPAPRPQPSITPKTKAPR